MNLGRLCQIILKSDKEISGYGQLAQHAIFAYHMVRQTPPIALPPLRFPGWILPFLAAPARTTNKTRLKFLFQWVIIFFKSDCLADPFTKGLLNFLFKQRLFSNRNFTSNVDHQHIRLKIFLYPIRLFL